MNYEAQCDYVNETNSFMRLCGIRVIRVDRDTAIAELDVSPDAFNPGGTLHGGAIYTLADAAATTAARTDGHRYATIDGSVQYHRAVTSGRVFAEAVIRHRGKSLCSAFVEIKNEDGKLLADATFSIFRLAPIDHPAFRSV